MIVVVERNCVRMLESRLGAEDDQRTFKDDLSSCIRRRGLRKERHEGGNHYIENITIVSKARVTIVTSKNIIQIMVRQQGSNIAVFRVLIRSKSILPDCSLDVAFTWNRMSLVYIWIVLQ